MPIPEDEIEHVEVEAEISELSSESAKFLGRLGSDWRAFEVNGNVFLYKPSKISEFEAQRQARRSLALQFAQGFPPSAGVEAGY